MSRMLVSFFEASATVAGSPGGAPALARPGTFSRTFEALGRLPLACWRFCMTGCITPQNSLHSCSESLQPATVRAGRRGSLACPASPARPTFGHPHAAAPEALGREGGDAQFCVTSQVFRCLDCRSCVRGGVRVLTHGCWGSCGCTTAPSVWKNGGRAREGLEPPSAGQMPGFGRRLYRTFDEGVAQMHNHEFTEIWAGSLQ